MAADMLCFVQQFESNNVEKVIDLSIFVSGQMKWSETFYHLIELVVIFSCENTNRASSTRQTRMNQFFDVIMS